MGLTAWVVVSHEVKYTTALMFLLTRLRINPSTCNNTEPQEEGGGEGLKGEITASVSALKVLKLLYRTQV